jgi:hypothetical protein
VQLLDDLRAMSFNRLRVNTEQRRYRLVAAPLRQKLDDLTLSLTRIWLILCR